MKRLALALAVCAACNDYDADYRACLASGRCPQEAGGGAAGGTAGGSAGGAAGGAAGGSAGGTAGGSAGGSAGGIAGGATAGGATAGGTAGGTSGGAAGGTAGGAAGGTWIDVTPSVPSVPFAFEPTLVAYPGSSGLYLAYVEQSTGKRRLKVLDGAGTPTGWSDVGTGSNAITRIAAVTDVGPWRNDAFTPPVPALLAGGSTTLSLATEYYPADGGDFFVHAIDNVGAFNAAVNVLAGPGSTAVPATGGNSAFSFRECTDGGAVARLVVALAGSSVIPFGNTLVSQATNGVDCNDVIDNFRTNLGIPSASIESNGPVIATFVPSNALIPGYGAGNGLYHFFTGTNYVHRAQFVGDTGKQNDGATMGSAARTTSSTLFVTTAGAGTTPNLAAFSVTSSGSAALPEDHLFETYETVCGRKAGVGWYQGAPLVVLCLGNGGSNHIQALQQIADGGWQRVQRAGSDFIEGPTCRFPTAPSMVLWEGGVNPMPIVAYGCGHPDGGHGLEVIELR